MPICIGRQVVVSFVGVMVTVRSRASRHVALFGILVRCWRIRIVGFVSWVVLFRFLMTFLEEYDDQPPKKVSDDSWGRLRSEDAWGVPRSYSPCTWEGTWDGETWADSPPPLVPLSDSSSCKSFRVFLFLIWFVNGLFSGSGVLGPSFSYLG
jgi:hypothetical protein